MEIWKNVVGYEDKYEVSNYGNVRNKKTNKLLSPFVNGKGYLRVNFLDNKKKLVHRLVAEAFLENPNNLTQVNHRDESKINNMLDNLEWISNADNCVYGSRKPQKISLHDGCETFVADSIMDAVRIFNLQHSNIIKCLKHERKSHKGFTFCYVD